MVLFSFDQFIYCLYLDQFIYFYILITNIWETSRKNSIMHFLGFIHHFSEVVGMNMWAQGLRLEHLHWGVLKEPGPKGPLRCQTKKIGHIGGS